MATVRFVQPRDVAGRFQKFEQEINNLMRKEAIEFQNQVADEIQHQIRRRTESKGRLVYVTLNSRNRKVNPISWRVGIPGYLDHSEAKYWRTIEQGSLAVWKRPFRGTPLKFSPSGFPGGRNFRSFSKTETANLRVKPTDALSQRGIAQRARHGRVVFVTKEIDPQNAYLKAWQHGNWKDRIGRDLREITRITS